MASRPDLTCGVWIGYDERQSLGKKQTGGEAAAPIWAEFMKAAMEGKPADDFQPPKGLENDFVHKRICLDSGLLATAFCLRTRDEIFKKETAPTRLCNLHTGSGSEEAVPGETSGEGVSAQPGEDILEMNAPAVKSAPTSASATPGGEEENPTNEKKPASAQEAYPDEGF